MKSQKRQLKEHVSPALLDIAKCLLHKVPNAFGHALAAFGSDIEAELMDTFASPETASRTCGYLCFLRNCIAKWASERQSQQPNLPENVFFFFSDMWARVGWHLAPALDQLIQQLHLVKKVVLSDQNAHCGGVLYNRLKLSLTLKGFLAKALFLKSVVVCSLGFWHHYRKEALLHILFSEMEVLTKKILGRFLRLEVYNEKSGEGLKLVDIHLSSDWKEHAEIGADTEALWLGTPC